MQIPQNVLVLMQALEGAGYEAWAVGGCVRDSLLGNTPQDYDLCTNALPEQVQACFDRYRQVLAGLKHGTVGVVTPEGVVEITTFRAEGDYGDARHPGWVRFVSTIEEDLSRRDFTINAMAFSPTRGWRDPFGGQADLEKKCLRCVGNPEARFREDALRILRGARFAARFGLTIEENTWRAMLAQAPGMDTLARERVFEELCRLLMVTDAASLCTLAPIVTRAVPALAPMVGFDQRSPHHRYDVFTHTAWVVQRVDADPALKLAALFHDSGKPATFFMDENGRGHFRDHAKAGAEITRQCLTELKAPAALRDEAVWLAENHMNYFKPDRHLLRRRLSRWGQQRVEKLLSLHRADLLGKDAEDISQSLAQLEESRQLLAQLIQEEGRFTVRDLAVNGKDLLQCGMTPGPEMKQMLSRLLEGVLSEELPNTRELLLDYVRTSLSQPTPKNE